MAVDNDFTRIPDSDVDRDSPLIQRLTRAWTSNQNHALALVRSDGSAICTGTADSVTDVSSSVVTDAAPSAGATADVEIGMVLEVVDGDAVGTFANVTGQSGSTITVDTNLVTAGMQAGDTYRILYGTASDMAHSHDGVDSAPIDYSDIGNTPETGIFTWVDDGTTFSEPSGLTSFAAIVPTGSSFALIDCYSELLINQLGLAATIADVQLSAREPGTGTYREIFRHGVDYDSGSAATDRDDELHNSSMAMVPLNSSRQADFSTSKTETAGSGSASATVTVEVRGYQ